MLARHRDAVSIHEFLTGLDWGRRFQPGPVLPEPVRDSAGVDRLRTEDPQQRLSFVYDAIRILRRELEGRAPLIGFAAAPFTLAVYLVEGGASKNFDRIKELLFGQPEVAHRLMEKIADATTAHLLAQIDAGAQAVQLFDTWAGLLTPQDYVEFDLRYTRLILDRLREAGAPRIYFALNSAHLFEEIRGCGADVVGIDWRTPLDTASERLDHRYVLQGNLDPCALLAGPEALERRTLEVLRTAAAAPGHIFNLGHGILPHTPVEQARKLVRLVQEYRRPEGP